MPPKTFIGVVSALLVAVLVGCGGDDSSSGDKAAGDKGGAANSAEVKKLIRQTFGPNDKAKSGNISAVVDLTVKGASSLQGAAPGQPRRAVHRCGRPARDEARRLAQPARRDPRRRHVPQGRQGVHRARLDRLRGPGVDRDPAARAAGQRRQLARPDPRRVQHQPRPVGEEPAHRRQRARGRDRHDPRHRGDQHEEPVPRPCRARQAPDVAADHRDHRAAARGRRPRLALRSAAR